MGVCDDIPLGLGRAGAQCASTGVTTHSGPHTKKKRTHNRRSCTQCTFCFVALALGRFCPSPSSVGRRYDVFVTDDSQSYLPLFALSEEAQTTSAFPPFFAGEPAVASAHAAVGTYAYFCVHLSAYSSVCVFVFVRRTDGGTGGSLVEDVVGSILVSSIDLGWRRQRR